MLSGAGAISSKSSLCSIARARCARGADVVVDRLLNRAGAVNLQDEPDLQGAEPARQLGAVIPERELRHVAVGDDVDVRSAVRECPLQPPRIADQQAAGVERREQPLVRIERHRIGAADRGQRRRDARRRAASEAAVGSIDVEPHAGVAAHTSAIASSGSIAPVLTSPALPTTQNGRNAEGAVGEDALAQRVDVHAEARCRRQSAATASLPMPSSARRLGNRHVRHRRRVDARLARQRRDADAG